MSWCQKFDIDRDRIFYIKSGKKYCAEQATQIVQFQQRNRAALRGSHILHDGGPAYKLGQNYILEDDAARVVVLPSAQHGELSPLDNKFNAIAKAMWRKERTNEDYSYDAILLLNCIDRVGQDEITSFFNHNFLLNTRNITLKEVEARLSFHHGKAPMRQALADKYADAYDQWLEEHEGVVGPDKYQALDDGLDGAYWK